MEMAKGRSRMDKGEWIKGNGVRPVVVAMEAGTGGGPGGRRAPGGPPGPGADGSRFCSCCGSFCLSQELAE
jgi:hypothetical protein